MPKPLFSWLFLRGQHDYEDNVTDFTSVPETIDRWLNRNNIAGDPAKILEVLSAYRDLYKLVTVHK